MLSRTPSRASRLESSAGFSAAWFSSINLVLFVPTAIAVMVLCLLPGADVPGVGLDDKIEHVAAYATLAILGLNAFPRWREGISLLMGLFLMGVTLEWLQLLVPGRSADVVDMAANVGGLIAGASLRVVAVRFMPIAAGIAPRRDTIGKVTAVREHPAQSARPK